MLVPRPCDLCKLFYGSKYLLDNLEGLEKQSKIVQTFLVFICGPPSYNADEVSPTAAANVTSASRDSQAKSACLSTK